VEVGSAMLNNVLGTKIGMTQLFDEKGNVVPVTVIDVKNWFVTQVKSSEKDGYAALQIGLLRKRYRSHDFSVAWLKAKKDYFLELKEIKPENIQNYVLGQAIDMSQFALHEGDLVAVTGCSKGLGFQGVVKRWGFSGGPDSHGSTFHRRPGSSGHLRRQGEIIKGKKFPGHTGDRQVTVKGLKVMRIDRDNGCVFVKGAVPGKKDALIAIRKQGV
jgi:large subunit ribosomal protein L3